jgi:alkanesulfonate monooxygenase
MPVEFLGIGGTNDGSETSARTVAQALLDYYDILGDAIDFGRYVIPIVRDEVAKRDAAADLKAREPHAVGS